MFVSLKPQNSDYLSEVEKKEVQNKLNALNMLTVRPVIVDADITKILITTTFKYNKTTPLCQDELETIVKNAIIKYDTDNLNNFDAIFSSKLVTAIDNAQSFIIIKHHKC